MYNGFSETKTIFLITINLPNKNKSHPLKLDKSHRGGEDRIIDKKKVSWLSMLRTQPGGI